MDNIIAVLIAFVPMAILIGVIVYGFVCIRKIISNQEKIISILCKNKWNEYDDN